MGENGFDSLRLTASSAPTASGPLEDNRELARYGHAMFLVMHQVISVHYSRDLQGWPASPLWLMEVVKLMLHPVAMPLAFALTAVLDATALPPAATRADAVAFVKTKVLVPHVVLLLVFHLICPLVAHYNSSLHVSGNPSGGVLPPLWFIQALMVMRLLRLGAWAARIPPAVEALLACALHLGSALEAAPMSVLRRCVDRDWRFAHGPSGGKDASGWSCQPTYPEWPMPQRPLLGFLLPY
eukprot:6561434-Prymnesium_polylepis.1